MLYLTVIHKEEILFLKNCKLNLGNFLSAFYFILFTPYPKPPIIVIFVDDIFSAVKCMLFEKKATLLPLWITAVTFGGDYSTVSGVYYFLQTQ